MKTKEFTGGAPFLKSNAVINADLLRFTAVVCMLADHVWASLLTGNDWLNYIGRAAFPIFAFQICEGFRHTSNLKRYFLRLAVFSLVSEIPFNLFVSGKVFYPQYQNVMFTLLLGLSAIFLIQKAKENPTPIIIAATGTAIFTLFFAAHVFKVDYGVCGVATVVCFFVFSEFRFAWVFQLISLIVINVLLFPGRYVSADLFGVNVAFPVQIFALFSLVPIWFYNGKKRLKSKAFTYGFYAFYPIHMLVFAAMRFF